MQSYEKPLATALCLLLSSLGFAACAPIDGDLEDLHEQEPDGPEPVAEAILGLTVAQAADSSCSTTSVKGLSEQIVAESNCISPGAFVAIDPAPNLSVGSAVFPYLEQPAKDAFAKALADKPGTTLTVNSMLRTVAQQYLLYRWYLKGQCGISLAAKPGNSNHETGLALDVSQYSTWRTTLESRGFKWLGSNDPVHFDYVGPGAVDHKGTDVLAFQRLWNANNPGDQIAEDGAYGPQTEARLVLAPATGFPIGKTCTEPSQNPDIHPAIGLPGGEDRFVDHSSAGILDLIEGDTYQLRMEITNKGGASASGVIAGVFVEEPFLVASDYLIETNFMQNGGWVENDANTNPQNPPHGAPLGSVFELQMNAFSPGETKRITLTVKADRYSIGLADAPDVRLWVKDVAGHYHQDDFGGPAQNDGSQTYGQKLETYLSTDIYSRTRWEWDTDRLEGWEGNNGVTLAADPATKTLLLGAQGDDPGMLGPETSFAAADFGAISLRAKRTGGTSSALIYFATSDEPTMDENKTLAFELPDDDVFHELEIDASAHPSWKGTVTRLRVDPFNAGPGSVEIDWMRMTPASVGAGGGSGTGGAGGGAANGASDTTASCACATPGREPSESGYPALLASLGLVAAVVSRRRSK